MHDWHDTIAAIASPAGSAARGIVRITGGQAIDCVAGVFCGDCPTEVDLSTLSRASMVTGSISLDGFHVPIPCELYVWPNARSYTRQPIVELHTLGSPPILQAALRTVCRCGARLAQPGEFTLRAFLAGRLDLTQAEAVLGVIDARGSQELDAALAQLAGGLAGPLVQLRDTLMDLLAHVEAGLDFVEEDIEFISRDQLRREIVAAHSQVQDLADRTTQRATLHDAVRVVLVGRPNAGKSSLFNALLNRPAALVSPTAGTTRDFVTGEVEIDGLRMELVDTAGLSTPDSHGFDEPSQQRTLEQASQQATGRARRNADLEVLCIDATQPLAPKDRSALDHLTSRQGLVVLTKTDQPIAVQGPPSTILTSSATGAGLDLLRARLRHAALDHGRRPSDVVAATAARCHESLRMAADSLAESLQLVDGHAGEELVAAQLRGALDELGQVVGAVYTDDLLDRIFSRFCIGK